MKITSVAVAGLLLAVAPLQTLRADNGHRELRKKYTQITLADTVSKAPVNWFNLDFTEDLIPGVSTEKAYTLLQNRTSRTVVVAIIDSGVDVKHEDLQGIVWVNPKEVAGNGLDDDKNGYADDINGWSFLGGKDGKNIVNDPYEVTRQYARLRKIF